MQARLFKSNLLQNQVLPQIAIPLVDTTRNDEPTNPESTSNNDASNNTESTSSNSETTHNDEPINANHNASFGQQPDYIKNFKVTYTSPAEEPNASLQQIGIIEVFSTPATFHTDDQTLSEPTEKIASSHSRLTVTSTIFTKKEPAATKNNHQSSQPANIPHKPFINLQEEQELRAAQQASLIKRKAAQPSENNLVANQPTFITRDGHQLQFTDSACSKVVINLPYSSKKSLTLNVKKQDPRLTLNTLLEQPQSWISRNLHLVLPEKDPAGAGLLYIGSNYKGHVSYQPPKVTNTPPPSIAPTNHTHASSALNVPQRPTLSLRPTSIQIQPPKLPTFYSPINLGLGLVVEGVKMIYGFNQASSRELEEQTAIQTGIDAYLEATRKHDEAVLAGIREERKRLVLQENAQKQAAKQQYKTQKALEEERKREENIQYLIDHRLYLEAQGIKKIIPSELMSPGMIKNEMDCFSYIMDDLKEDLDYYPSTEHKKIVIRRAKEMLQEMTRLRKKTLRWRTAMDYFLANPTENIQYVFKCDAFKPYFTREHQQQIEQILLELEQVEKPIQGLFEIVGEDISKHKPNPKAEPLPETEAEKEIYTLLELELHTTNEVPGLVEKCRQQCEILVQKIQKRTSSSQIPSIKAEGKTFISQAQKLSSFLTNKQQGIFALYANNTSDAYQNLPLQEGIEKYMLLDTAISTITKYENKIYHKTKRLDNQGIELQEFRRTPYLADKEGLRRFYKKMVRELQPSSSFAHDLSHLNQLPKTPEEWAELGLTQTFLERFNTYKHPLAKHFDLYVTIQPDLKSKIKNFLIYQLEKRDYCLNPQPASSSIFAPLATTTSYITTYLESAQLLSEKKKKEQGASLLQMVETLKKQEKSSP